MTSSRCLIAAVALLALASITFSARADLFVVDISTRTYMLNGKGEVTFRAGNQRQIIDLAAQNASVDAKVLVLAYDTDTDAFEVVRKDDGTIIQTIMSFSSPTDVENAGKTREYRQAFVTLPNSNAVNGSIDGSVRISYDSKANITAFRWNGSFQYSIPGSMTALNQVVHGMFSVERSVHEKAIP